MFYALLLQSDIDIPANGSLPLLLLHTKLQMGSLGGVLFCALCLIVAKGGWGASLDQEVAGSNPARAILCP